MDLNSGKLIDRPRVIEVPITPTIIKAMERIAAKQKAYKGLKMTNKHGNSYSDVDLGAGVDRAVEEEYMLQDKGNDPEQEDVIENSHEEVMDNEPEDDTPDDSYDDPPDTDVSEVLYKAEEPAPPEAAQPDDDDDLPELIDNHEDSDSDDDSDDEEEERRYPTRERRTVERLEPKMSGQSYAQEKAHASKSEQSGNPRSKGNE